MNEARFRETLRDQLNVGSAVWGFLQEEHGAGFLLFRLMEDVAGKVSQQIEELVFVEVGCDPMLPDGIRSGVHEFHLPAIMHRGEIGIEYLAFLASHDSRMRSQHEVEPSRATARGPNDEDYSIALHLRDPFGPSLRPRALPTSDRAARLFIRG
jgi:hypothetical protein